MKRKGKLKERGKRGRIHKRSKGRGRRRERCVGGKEEGGGGEKGT